MGLCITIDIYMCLLHVWNHLELSRSEQMKVDSSSMVLKHVLCFFWIISNATDTLRLSKRQKAKNFVTLIIISRIRPARATNTLYITTFACKKTCAMLHYAWRANTVLFAFQKTDFLYYRFLDVHAICRVTSTRKPFSRLTITSFNKFDLQKQ